MVFTIGTGANAVDMVKYVAHDDGFKWQRYDIDSPNTGRTLDGLMHRGRVATKIRLDIKCRPLKADELSIVLNAILPGNDFEFGATANSDNAGNLGKY